MYSEARTYLILAGWKPIIDSSQISFTNNNFTRKIVYRPSTEAFLSLPTSNATDATDAYTSFVKATAQNATIIRHGGLKTLIKLAQQKERLLTQ